MPLKDYSNKALKLIAKLSAACTSDKKNSAAHSASNAKVLLDKDGQPISAEQIEQQKITHEDLTRYKFAALGWTIDLALAKKTPPSSAKKAEETAAARPTVFGNTQILDDVAQTSVVQTKSIKKQARSYRIDQNKLNQVKASLLKVESAVDAAVDNLHIEDDNQGESLQSSLSKVPSANRDFRMNAVFDAGDDSDEDTLLADKWSGTEFGSLFSLPDEEQFLVASSKPQEPAKAKSALASAVSREISTILNELPPDLHDTNWSAPKNSTIHDYAEDEGSLSDVIWLRERIEAQTGHSHSVSNCASSTYNNLVSTPAPATKSTLNVLKLVAQKVETPTTTLAWLSKHENPHVRAAVAKNPRTPEKIIVNLARDPEKAIRHSIAENINACEEALQLLTSDENSLISYRAKNTLDQRRLEKEPARPSDSSAPKPSPRPASKPSLSRDASKPVSTPWCPPPGSARTTPAASQTEWKGPKESRETLAKTQWLAPSASPSPATSPAASTAPKAPIKPIEIDLAPASIDQAARKTQREGMSISDEEAEFLMMVAKRSSTPASRLTQLAAHDDSRVRAAAAENANTPTDTLRRLAQDKWPTVKLKVIENFNCPLELLTTLQEDEDPYVAYQAHTAVLRIMGATYSDSGHIRSVTWP